MATQNATNPDTLITIKVAINGSNRRFKLALRDLGANVFSQRLRFLLAISPSQNVLFERYSDSAAAYIVLDENNPSVYKQLYRAAKAKLKLRIKATLAEDSNIGEQTSAQSSSSPPNTSNFYQAPPAYASRLSLQSINGIPRPVEPPVTLAAAASTSDPLNLPPKGIPVPSVKEAVENDVRRQRASEYNPSDRETMLRTIRKLRSSGTLDEMDKKLSPPSSAAGQNSNAKDAEEQGTYRDSLVALQRIMQARREMAIRIKPEAAAPSSTPVPPAPQAKSYSGPYVCGFSQANNFRSYPFLNSYAIYCNACDIPIPDAHHFHCSVCEDGDFDLCQNCVDKGVHCGSEEHWLIKRIMKDGKVINSTTENIEPKNMKLESTVKDDTHAQDKTPEEERTRTCNCCVEVFPETNFVTCTTCPDYDLCIPCHVGMAHGHYPRHGFKPATEDAKLDLLATLLLKPGRNIQHYAICDGCDKSIYGVRHKCLNCPDWDYCSNCIQNARFIHPGHRFVPIYEPINTPTPWISRHNGIFCDGPLCQAKGSRSYIVGDRYKCAVCHDTDFCANCEASPTNKHNRTHPLIKFKTPIKNVTVTTLGEKENGEEMLTMGDAHAQTRSTATETTPATCSSNAATQVQTVADLQPSEETVIKEEPKPTFTQPLPSYETAAELQATFVSDVVADGSKLPPNHVFKQTWRLLNPGPGSWPAGCSVKFVGGDNMLALDPQHVSSLIDLGNAAESNTLDRVVPAGDEAEFTVSMRTPSREGKCISYWRLTGPNGMKFGHKLWCDVDVCQTLPTEPAETEHVEDVAEETSLEEPNSMIFPKLEKESPIASQHESVPATEGAGAAFSALEQLRKEEQEEILSDIASLDEDDDDDDISFLTDDEYDVLDASDEDFLAEAQNGLKK